MNERWQELREIETQRSDIITKLHRIEEKKSTVSIEVYGKVKKDYEEKLKTVDEQMAQHVDLVKTELASLHQEEEKITKQEKEIKFKIEEIELRYSIGEYDEESFKKMHEENNESLNAVKMQLQKLQERRKWLEDFVELKSIEESIEEAIEEAIEPPKETIEPKEPEPEIKIEEHVLDKELPEQEAKLDELLVEEEELAPEKQEITPESAEEPPSGEKEVGKNVPCPKCGHLNAPDSWYCEKCGAEILNSPSQ